MNHGLSISSCHPRLAGFRLATPSHSPPHTRKTTPRRQHHEKRPNDHNHDEKGPVAGDPRRHAASAAATAAAATAAAATPRRATLAAVAERASARAAARRPVQEVGARDLARIRICERAVHLAAVAIARRHAPPPARRVEQDQAALHAARRALSRGARGAVAAIATRLSIREARADARSADVAAARYLALRRATPVVGGIAHGAVDEPARCWIAALTVGAAALFASAVALLAGLDDAVATHAARNRRHVLVARQARRADEVALHGRADGCDGARRKVRHAGRRRRVHDEPPIGVATALAERAAPLRGARVAVCRAVVDGPKVVTEFVCQDLPLGPRPDHDIGSWCSPRAATRSVAYRSNPRDADGLARLACTKQRPDGVAVHPDAASPVGEALESTRDVDLAAAAQHVFAKLVRRVELARVGAVRGNSEECNLPRGRAIGRRSKQSSEIQTIQAAALASHQGLVARGQIQVNLIKVEFGNGACRVPLLPLPEFMAVVWTLCGFSPCHQVRAPVFHRHVRLPVGSCSSVGRVCHDMIFDAVNAECAFAQLLPVPDDERHPCPSRRRQCLRLSTPFLLQQRCAAKRQVAACRYSIYRLYGSVRVKMAYNHWV
ncbi:hypothetical protein MHUMG1_09541 [Metarhizium humberi]|uniref:Uncharacterized protein n=1 Tax=Metarhizium humberi TaxID=2596975 RepID=A0A9P8M2U4_9HYPO|nr:hypothetical protein MHUMG1_09541 [Metarhizium humberi]